MPPQRQIHQLSPFGATRFDVGLWHLGAGLLATGAALGATVGLSGSPWSLAVTLWSGLPAPDELAHRVDVEVLFRSPSTMQLDTVVLIVTLIAWVLWLWLVGTTLLRIVVIAADRIAAGARWPARLRALSDRVTPSLVRRAVDATLAGEVLLRSITPVATPAVMTRLEYALVQSLATDEPDSGAYMGGNQSPAMAEDVGPDDVLYMVQSGDNLSAIAERFYGDPAAFPRIVAANLGRQQPGGTTLRDARFIYPGWQLVIPEPTQSVDADAEGQRWYTVRRRDTLSEISARFLGDWHRYPELFADNEGAALGDGHVLTNPDLIWPGLRLRLPVDPGEGGVVEPEPAPLPAPSATSISTPAAPTPTARSDTNQSSAESPGNAGVEPTLVPTPEGPELPVGGGVGGGISNGNHWPEWLPGDAETDLGVAGGVAAVALLAIGARRRRRAAPEPESDTRLDEHAFGIAEPAVVAASRAAGEGTDPHGIVLGELVAGEVMRHSRVAELSSAQVISVIGGRSSSVLTLSTSLEDRPLLEAALRTDTQLARRVDVSRSADQDVVVSLQGIRHQALARVAVQDCPVLLCVGMLPDSRSYLVGWQALGHVLAASQPGTTDAEEHLVALVATLAGQLAPSDLQLYTVAGLDATIRQLAPLPHQRAVVDSADATAVAGVLRDLRTELERRQLTGYEAGAPELVLVAGELADIEAREELTSLLSDGVRWGVRVLAATAESGIERAPIVDQFSSRLVFGLKNEEASTRLLGTTWALTLAEPGRLLVRLAQRKAVEVLGLHLTEEGRLALLASMGVSEPEPVTAPETSPVGQLESEAAQFLDARDDAEPAPVASPSLSQKGLLTDNPPRTGPGALATAAEAAGQPFASIADLDDRPGVRAENVLDNFQPASETRDDASLPTSCPDRIGRLLRIAPLVVDCDEASVWSTREQLDIGLSSPVEVLLYLAAAPLLHQGRLADWAGVQAETLLAEVWAPRARDPENRDSAQTWLGKNLARLQEEISRAMGGLNAQLIVKDAGSLRLNPDVVASDVEVFMAALERARAAQGAEQMRAAEEAFHLRTPGLLSRVVRKPKTTGPKVEFFRWLGQQHWERAAARLDALGRDAAMLLARAYRDASRYEDALSRYDELLCDEPLDPRAQEGLLIAAAGTRDVVRLEQAWQQVCACLGGDCDSDVRALYERLKRELSSVRSSNGNGSSRVGRGDGSQDVVKVRL